MTALCLKYPITDWIPTHAAVNQQRYPQPGDPNPSVRVGVVRASGGRTTWLKIPLVAGDDYIPRFGWIDAHTVWVETVTRDHKHRNLYFADTTSPKGEVKLVLTEKDDKFFDEAYDLTFSLAIPFLWTSWRDGPHSHLRSTALTRRIVHMASEAKLAKAADAWRLRSGIGEARSMKPPKTIYYVSNEGDAREEQLWAVSRWMAQASTR